MALISLPPDPTHEIYLKTCFVCQELAKPGQEHIRNYGGIVCFSCRQFFRRAHQKTKEPTFHCTFGGNCLITVKSRRRCQKCRYDRCLFAGMVPAAVLTDEEKTVRFRKFQQKKKAKILSRISEKAEEDKPPRKRRSARDVVVEDNSNSNDENIEPISATVAKRSRMDLNVHQNKKSSKHSSSSHFLWPPTSSSSSSRAKPSSTVVRATIDLDSDDPARPWPALMNSKIDLIVQRYQMTLAQMQTELTEELFFKLEAIQSGDMTVSVSKSEIFDHLTQVSKQFHHFALLHSQFNKLRKKDQRQLLARNTPLYIQLYMAFYFSTPKGSHLLGHIREVSQNPGHITSNFDRDSLIYNQWFNAINMIFKSGANIHYYAQLFESLKALRLSCAKVRAVLSYIILFDFDVRMNIADAFVLEDISILNEIMFLSCVKKNSDNFSVDNLISTLSQMAIFGASNISWKKEGIVSIQSSTIISNIFLANSSFTPDEIGWLANQCRAMNKALNSVTQTEENLREYLMSFMGVQLNINYLINSCRAFQERILRLLSIYPEFQDLPDVAKKAIWRRAAPMGIAFMVVKKEMTDKGVDQLMDEYGGLSRNSFEKLFRSHFASPGKLKRMWYQKGFLQQLEIGFQSLKLSEILKDHAEDRTVNQLLEKSSKVQEDMKSSFRDPVLEKIMLMLAVTKESLPKLHETYLNLLCRHVATRGIQTRFCANGTSRSVDFIIQSLTKLEGVADLLTQLV